MSARVPPPLTGFNSNFRYRGMSFHIQTEDSGMARPHIITHLFADGGQVIKTLRVDYSQHVSGPDCRTVVQRMMRDQHRAMANDLRKGLVDAIIDRLVPRQPPSGADDVARSRPPSANASGSSERREPVPLAISQPAPSTNEAVRAIAANDEKARPKPGPLAAPVLGAVSARRGPRSSVVFAALPSDSLDSLILGYIAGGPR
jgi:hypothetical protein